MVNEGLGILETIIENLKEKVYENEGVVRLDYIVDFIRDLQEKEYDAHIVIQGQNGNGKSCAALAITKKLDSKALEKKQILFAFNNTRDFVRMIKEKKKTVIMIDELKKYFHYRQSMTTEQIVLTNIIEYARSHNIAFVGCCNDIRRINSNYRNAKVQMVIWLLDRLEHDVVKSYGLVFVGNPALEEEDKFMMNSFQNIYSFEQIRLIAEGLPTFIGYLFVEDVLETITKEELDLYYQLKNEGIQKEAERYIDKLEKKEKYFEEKYGGLIKSDDEILDEIFEKIKGLDIVSQIKELNKHAKDKALSPKHRKVILKRLRDLRDEYIKQNEIELKRPHGDVYE